MDGHYPSPTARLGERRSTPAAVARPSGLPIVSTAPLTAAERDVLHNLERAARVLTDNLAEAVAANRVDLTLEACGKLAELGDLARRTSTLLGSSR
jgi:hypothetical protein